MLRQHLLVWDQVVVLAAVRRRTMKTKTKRQLYITFVTLAALLMFAAPALACLGSTGGSGGC